MIALAQVVLGAMLIAWAERKCTELDVATGRRDHMALYDDYGSNRGWYWPWSLLTIIGFLVCLTAPITLIWESR